MQRWYPASGTLRWPGFTKVSTKPTALMLNFPFCFRFLLWAGVGATVFAMADSKKDVALLTAVFLLTLGALETVLTFIGA